MNLDDLLRQHRLLVVLGRGGVGKTTVSAALSVKAATLGLKTIVITIDPANRLADALAVKDRMDAPTRVPLSKPEYDLSGLMMDRRKTCDELVARFSETDELKEQILKNPYYQHFSTSLAGGQEYMAIEKVRQILASESYDLVVLDTPPAIHAFDFLDAPNRLISALKKIPSSKKPKANSIIARLKRKGGQIVLDGLKRFTGGQFLSDLTSFLGLFRQVLSALESSSISLESTLRRDNTGFIFVDVPDHSSNERLTVCTQQLDDRDLKLSGIIFNRTRPQFKVSELSTWSELDAMLADAVSAEQSQILKEELSVYVKRSDFEGRTLRETIREDKLDGVPMWSVPIQRNWISNAHSLQELSDRIQAVKP